MHHPAQDIDRLAEAVREHLLPILREGLDVCVARHRIARGEGADNISFGTDAWSVPARRFRDQVDDGAIPFAYDHHRWGCVLTYESFRIRHHRVGVSEQDDIRTSFPHNAKGLRTETEGLRQCEFDFGADSPAPVSEGIVLAYMANPDDGLCAAYLTTVKEMRKAEIRAWDQIVELWRRDAAELAAEEAARRHPAETIPRPVVSRREPPRGHDEHHPRGAAHP